MHTMHLVRKLPYQFTRSW